MHFTKINRSILSLAVLLLAAGCAKKTPEPKVASSADAPGYALAYPGELSERLTRYTEHSVDAKENGAAFGAYPDALKEPDWQAVMEVYAAADEAGRGAAFANEMAAERHVRRFFDEEKDDLTRRTNGAVSNALKKSECKCEPDTHGAVAFALRDGVDKRLEKRLLEAGGTEALIEDNEARLGKKNVKTLSEQATAISYAAYIVYVELPTIYQELSRMLDEAKSVKQTLERELASENAKQQDDARSKAERKEAEKAAAAINDALSTIKIFEEEAKRLLDRGIEEIPAIQAAYEESFDGLMDTVKARIQK